jgi:hypothetical protein
MTIAVFTKIASSESGNYTVNIDGGVNRTIFAQITAFSGVDQTIPMDATAVGNMGQSSTDVDGLAITTTTSNAWVESIAAGRAASIGSPTTPAGYTVNGVKAGTSNWFGGGYKAVVSAGSENPAPWVFGASVTGGAVTLAYRAASGAGSAPTWTTDPPNPPDGTVSQVYAGHDFSNDIDDTTGVTYSLTAGTFPGGLTLNTSSGLLSGTPTTEENRTGIRVTATNATGGTQSLAFSINIGAAAGGGTVPVIANYFRRMRD